MYDFGVGVAGLCYASMVEECRWWSDQREPLAWPNDAGPGKFQLPDGAKRQQLQHVA